MRSRLASTLVEENWRSDVFSSRTIRSKTTSSIGRRSLLTVVVLISRSMARVCPTDSVCGPTAKFSRRSISSWLSSLVSAIRVAASDSPVLLSRPQSRSSPVPPFSPPPSLSMGVLIRSSGSAIG
ncbi:hypothetical protein D3C72_2102570 [compost metagenome]